MDKILLSIIISFFGGGGAIALLFFFNPEKCEIWASIFFKIVKIFWRKAEKQYIALDIQGHVNDFNKKLKKEVKNYEPVGVKIKWVTEGETEKSFFQSNSLILRIRKSEDQNKNFVLAAMTFISQVILKKAKRYISQTQKESIDLFVGKKLFEKEKPAVVDHFVENFLIPQTESSQKIAEYFDKYSLIDKVGLFFPVLIQELNFLGSKVFGGKKESEIIKEVNGLIDVLKNYSGREIGEEGKSYTFNGRYCHFGIMIVARGWKVELGNTKPYIKYIQKLLSFGIENVYIIGAARSENTCFIQEICKTAEEQFNTECFFEKKYDAWVKIRGKREKVENFLVLLRKPNAQYHYDTEDQKEEV